MGKGIHVPANFHGERLLMEAHLRLFAMRLDLTRAREQGDRLLERSLSRQVEQQERRLPPMPEELRSMLLRLVTETLERRRQSG